VLGYVGNTDVIVWVSAVHLNIASYRAECPNNQFKERAFSSAIRTNDSYSLTRVYTKGNIFQGKAAAVFIRVAGLAGTAVTTRRISGIHMMGFYRWSGVNVRNAPFFFFSTKDSHIDILYHEMFGDW
jgi:hypothetical protein